MVRFIIVLICMPFLGFSQTLFDPQVNYETPGGFFDKDSLRDIYLDFYDPNYHNVLVNSWYYKPDARIPAKLTLNGIEYDSVGVRYKGNSTFCLPNDDFNPKVPYNIDMNFWVAGQKLLGYKKVKLANAWMDPTFAKDFTASKIYSKYLPSGEVNLVKLHCQGSYLGLYVNTESINKQFLQKHFNEKGGALFKCDNINRFCDTTNAPSAMPPNLFYMGDDSSLYYNSYDMKSDFGWAELVNLIKTIDNDFANIDNILNVDRTLWAFAVNQATSNLDCYNTYYVHNYYLYQTGDGLFQMIPWDLDNSFVGAILGNFWPWSGAYEYDPYFTAPAPGTAQPWEERPLLYKLLNNPLYRKQYTAHLRTIMNESLDTAVIRSQISDLQSIAYSAANNDQYKLFSMPQYYSNVESALWTGSWSFGGILSSIDERKAFLLDHSEISMAPPDISFVQEANGGNLITAEVSNATTVELMATISPYSSKFMPFTMYDNGTNGDAVSGDGIYSAFRPDFPPNTETLKYYIRAQNTDAMILSPERAEYEYYYSEPPPVGVADRAHEKFSIHPNPITDKTYIYWDNPSNEEVQVVLNDINGRSLRRFTMYGAGMLLPKGDLAPGIYLLSVQGSFGVSQQKLIVR